MPRTDLQLSAHDLSPDADSVDHMVDALKEIKICKDLFDGWMRELDKGSWTQRTEEEHQLVWAIDKLRNDAHDAYASSKKILSSQRSFADAMSDMLHDSASMDSFYEDCLIRDNTRVMCSGDSIVSHSMALSSHVASMQEELDSLVTMVNGWKQGQKGRLFPVVWDWILKAFTAILSLVAAGTAFVPLLKSMGSTTSTTLGSGARLASALTDLVRDTQDQREEVATQRVLHFLQYRLPLEAQRIEACMISFRGCHSLIQMDEALREGRAVKMTAENSRKARDRWQMHKKRFEPVRDDLDDSEYESCDDTRSSLLD